MNNHGSVVFSLPESLRQQAEKLLAADRRNAERREHLKRFARGISDDDLTGFSLNGQPLGVRQLPLHLRGLRSEKVMQRIPGHLPVKAVPLRESWLDFSASLQTVLQSEMKTGSQFRELINGYRDRQQLPSWLDAFASHRGRHYLDPARATPYFKMNDEVAAQARYVETMVEVRPELAKYFVPMIAFELEPQNSICVMPFLNEFVTLDDLICVASGIKSINSFPIERHEAVDVLPEVISQLGEVYRVARGATSTPTAAKVILSKIQERFRATNDVPLLIGEQLLDSMREFVTHACADNFESLWEQTRQDELAFGHGDLNATNIMIAVERRPSAGITDVCLRLIDPNPESMMGHTFLELSRLIHWVELGIPLRCGHTESASTFELGYSGSEVEEEFLNRPPRLALKRDWRKKLEPVYACLWKALRLAFPTLDRAETQQLLTLGTGYFHLVATRYWSRNIERTSAFWAGVGELQTLPGMKRVVDFYGLASVRRRLRRGGS